MALVDEVKNILQSCKDHLALIEELKSENAPGDHQFENFSLTDFWEKLGATAKVVSHESTKFCLAFRNKPHPNEDSCKQLCQALQASCLCLASIFNGLPIECGKSLQQTTKSAVLSVISSNKDLISQFLYADSPEQQQLIITGNVWESCEAIEQLPKDNKEAVLLLLKQEASLVQDAAEELEMAMQSEEEAEVEWSSSDMILLPSCLGLVKTAKACLKKTMQAVENDSNPLSRVTTVDLDSLGAVTNQISENVDNFITNLYPPIDRLNVNEMSTTLSTCLYSTLDAVRSTYLATEDAQEWIEFLEKAIKHNYDKVQKMTDQNRAG